MAKTFSNFICQQCGYQSSQFLGKCPECGQWNSLVETAVSAGDEKREAINFKLDDKLFRLADIKSQKFNRLSSGFDEFDRVLGGGIVPGSIVLVSGDPGIGKSTLLLQTAIRIAGSMGKWEGRKVGQKANKINPPSHKPTIPQTRNILYVSGEESAQQIKMRAERIGKIGNNLYILPETNAETIVSAAQRLSCALVVIDSIQTLTSERLTGSAGSVGQLRECAQILQRFAKDNGVPVFIVGHVTKEGSIAGPKVLEHIVDTVLVLEGDDMHAFRILRSSKNRFGSTWEVGIFEMHDEGMLEVTNPSQIFLEERIETRAGGVVCATIAGGRPLLAEVQALTTATVFAVPTRRVTGLDFSRVQIVLAAISKFSKLSLANLDIFVNVAGGLKIVEPAADLAVALACVSAVLDKPVKKGICVFGEVGLLGELRAISNTSARIAEAKRLGFVDFVTPQRFKTLEDAVSYVIHGE
ncbi:hypothetical protein A3A60_01320 [Candidatus Curtissbacteria bacterium RIFCSPLOWO2_01_FULL_42_26]|uniref:DNA repair protein RadA n=1 Tax=Candidatus Curtissbacteria bacterium RIFCSPLOWO2_01_FULL_42_26 TaxID=1797729 RepID=A0A1F5HYY6_9BACT|nr:MAG: hypothetical protein A3A60_01320 [Candidatus Curtissbacteria bacterium RIFCSPLOWO2_01_FULL_42_26]